MKKTQYQCLKCYNVMHFQIRDVGRIPEVVGCKKDGCDGRSVENPKLDPTDGNPDAIFFKPKNGQEWNAIKHQAKFEMEGRYKDKNRQQKRQLIKTIMNNFQDHVKKGGLLFLPFSYFTKSGE